MTQTLEAAHAYASGNRLPALERSEILQKTADELAACIEANLALMIYKLVESGAEAAIVEPITAKEMEGRELCIKPFHPTITFEPGIAFPANRPCTKIAQSFAAHFKQLFEEDFNDNGP